MSLQHNEVLKYEMRVTKTQMSELLRHSLPKRITSQVDQAHPMKGTITNGLVHCGKPIYGLELTELIF